MFDFRFCAVPELENSYQVLSKGQLKWRDEDEIIVLTWSLLCGVMFGSSGLSDKIVLDTTSFTITMNKL